MGIKSGLAVAGAFPRGKVKKAHQEDQQKDPHKKVSQDHRDRDRDLFQTSDHANKSGPKKKKKKSGGKSEDGSDILKVVSAEELNYRHLSEGMNVLGCVSSVGDYELKVSLPGRLVGTVPITHVSKAYTKALHQVTEGQTEQDLSLRTLGDMFYAGQVVLTRVKSVELTEDRFYKVTLSLAPHSVHEHLAASFLKKGFLLQSAVSSVEDHGYIMDVGLPGIRAFLPAKKAEKYVQELMNGQDLTVGQIVPTLVIKSDPLGLSAEPVKLKKAWLDMEQVSIHTLLPGTSVRAKMEKRLQNGFKVKLGGSLEGFVHDRHAPLDPPEEGEELDLRVLYILPTVNTIYLTAREHFRYGAKMSSPFDTLEVGATVKEAEVLESSQNGLILNLADGVQGFVSARNVSENKEVPKDIKSKFPVGSKQSCRLVQYDYSDRLFICSMQKTVINQKVLQASQLKCGDKVNCTLKKYLNKGVLVEVGKGIEGFIPLLHLTDVVLKNPEKKYPVGSKLTCRVLRTDPSKRKLHLTHKSILVKENYEVVSEFDPQTIGVVTEGTVVSVSSEGLLLQLYGDVRGWVPKTMMSAELIEYPEKLFFIGQVLKCQVVQVEVAARRMTLSLIIGGHHKPLGSKERKEGEKIKLGMFYDVTVAEVAEDGLKVKIDDHNVKAFIPGHHLTDHTMLAQMLLQSYKPGDKITRALCFEKDVMPIMTLKPMIIQATESDILPKSFDDLQEGVSLPGVVCLIKNYGVFIRLPTWKFRKSALVPTRHLADFFVEDPGELVTVHQTVVGKVIERNEAEQKVTMSTKLKDLDVKGTSPSVQLLSGFFADLERLKNTGENKLKSFSSGMVVEGTVSQVMDMGVSVDVQGVQGIITATGMEGVKKSNIKAGKKLQAVVISVDYQYGCLELSACPDLIAKVSKASTKKELKAGSVVKAFAVSEKEEFNYVTMCIKSPAAHGGRFIHVASSHHINDYEGFGHLFTTGETYNVVVKEEQAGHYIGVLEKHEQKGAKLPKRKRTESVSREEDPSPAARKRKDSEISTQSDQDSPEKKRKRNDSENESSVKANVVDPGWDEDFNPWDKSGAKTSESSEGGDNETQKKKTKSHLSKKEKKELDRMEAEEIARAEQRILDGEEAEPETTEEFDRLVLSSPNSSICWIKYMAFHMGRQEYEKAREVAKRALEKINFREDEEKLNVYMAWFNLENSFGSDETTDEVFAKAIKFNDEYKVYKQAANIYSLSDKPEKALKLLKVMVKKFCKEPEVWILLGTLYFKQKDLKEARFTLQRSIQNLDKKHHVAITSKFGQLEFKLGEVERAKTIFETILGNYPRRTDLWSVYVDMLVKANELEGARTILERMILLNLQPKKMKLFFKKYLEFEQAHGDQQKVDRIRKKALDYVESKVGVSGGESMMETD